MAQPGAAGRPPGALRRALVPLALAQFICSFAGSNMNVMITDISTDLDTTVQGVQTVITVFLLVMAAGSLLGTFIGSRLLGIVPTSVLLPILAAVLIISAVKVWRHQ